MAQVAARSFVNTSCVYQALVETETTDSVGEENPMTLPLVRIGKIGQHLGTRLARGDVGLIYEIKGKERVFKFIPMENFKRGDEIRAAQVAGELGIGPKVHAAFVMQQQNQKFVAIEMDKVARSLSGWMQVLAKDKDPKIADTFKLPTLEEEEALAEELMKKAKEDAGPDATWVAVSMPQKERIEMEEAVEILHGKQETFYFQLFSNIKRLAEKNIAFLDTNCGNIIPNWGLEKNVQLIDFDGARVTKRVSEAAYKVLNGFYTSQLLKDFSNLPDLSEASQSLINWFKKEALGEVMTQFREIQIPDPKDD